MRLNNLSCTNSKTYFGSKQSFFSFNVIASLYSEHRLLDDCKAASTNKHTMSKHSMFLFLTTNCLWDCSAVCKVPSIFVFRFVHQLTAELLIPNKLRTGEKIISDSSHSITFCTPTKSIANKTMWTLKGCSIYIWNEYIYIFFTVYSILHSNWLRDCRRMSTARQIYAGKFSTWQIHIRYS